MAHAASPSRKMWTCAVGPADAHRRLCGHDVAWAMHPKNSSPDAGMLPEEVSYSLLSLRLVLGALEN